MYAVTGQKLSSFEEKADDFLSREILLDLMEAVTLMSNKRDSLPYYAANKCRYHSHKKNEECYLMKYQRKWGYIVPEKEAIEVRSSVGLHSTSREDANIVLSDHTIRVRNLFRDSLYSDQPDESFTAIYSIEMLHLYSQSPQQAQPKFSTTTNIRMTVRASAAALAMPSHTMIL